MDALSRRDETDARLRYQADLLDNVSDAIIAVDTAFVVQSWNRAAEIMYGWPVQEAIGQPLTALTLTKYERDQAYSILNGLLRARSWRGELTQFNRLGEALQVQVSSSVLKNEAGVVTGLVMLSQDITERRQSILEEARQRRMAEALQETASLLNSSLNLNVVLDRLLIQVERVLPYDTASIMLIDNGVATISHHRKFESRGFKPADMAVFKLTVQEKESLRWMYEQRRPMLIADTAQASWWSQEPAAVWIKSYLGSPIQLDDEVIGFINLDKAEVNGFTWEQADLLKSFGDQAAVAVRNARLYNLVERYAQDQERQVIARTADLERERGQLRAILDSMSEGVMCVMFDDPPRQIVNPALLRMTGLTEADLSWGALRAHSVDRQEFESLVEEMVARVADKGVSHVMTPIRRGVDGEFEAHIDCSAICDQQGNVIGILYVFRDISEEKALAEQKSRFVANASHELRTPLTNLMTRLYIFRRAPERHEEHLTILEEVANRMRRLVDDLLDYSRFERGMIPIEPARVDLTGILQAVIEGQRQEAEQKSIPLELELPPTPLFTLADADRISQVFTNLVTNAINYTGHEGRITVRARLDKAADSPPEAVIEVEDTGVGIPAAVLADIFKPFVRAHENTRGTGLGLSISHDIVRLHGGTLSVSSEVGKGSTFTVRLPASLPT
jgi:PAS domain S-box-containing protein